MTGLMQSIPDDPDTMVVVESTANGMGGPFYDLWVAANEGRNDFLPIFFAWWEHPEYSRPLDITPEQFQSSLDADEHELQVRWSVQLEQLAWRRWAIRNKCEGKLERFKQEYPSTPEEAFQASGRMRIPAWVVAQHTAREPKLIGELREETHGTRNVIRLQDNPSGILKVWDDPGEQTNCFVIGADVAEGLDANEGLGSADPDYSIADVFAYPVGIQVAQLRDRLTPAEFGHYLYALGKWYNWALLGLEVNGPGGATLQVLLDRGYPLDRIARRVVYDGAGRPAGDKLGFKVTSVNREQIISGYENALATPGDGGIILRSYVSINEVYTFHIRQSRGQSGAKPQAISGRHDDSIFSGGHAVEAMKQAPLIFGRIVNDRGFTQNKPKQYAPSLREQLRQSY